MQMNSLEELDLTHADEQQPPSAVVNASDEQRPTADPPGAAQHADPDAQPVNHALAELEAAEEREREAAEVLGRQVLAAQRREQRLSEARASRARIVAELAEARRALDAATEARLIGCGLREDRVGSWSRFGESVHQLAIAIEGHIARCSLKGHAKHAIDRPSDAGDQIEGVRVALRELETIAAFGDAARRLAASALEADPEFDRQFEAARASKATAIEAARDAVAGAQRRLDEAEDLVRRLAGESCAELDEAQREHAAAAQRVSDLLFNLPREERAERLRRSTAAARSAAAEAKAAPDSARELAKACLDRLSVDMAVFVDADPAAAFEAKVARDELSRILA